MKQYAGKKFLLLATPATVASGIYAQALKDVVMLDSLGVPGLAGAIEFGESDEKVASLVALALQAKKGVQYDGVILGCTHYPLALSVLAPLIKEYVGTELIVDPGLPVAEDAAEAFEKHEGGVMQFLISKENESFRKRVAMLFPQESYTIEIV